MMHRLQVFRHTQGSSKSLLLDIHIRLEKVQLEICRCHQSDSYDTGVQPTLHGASHSHQMECQARDWSLKSHPLKHSSHHRNLQVEQCGGFLIINISSEFWAANDGVACDFFPFKYRTRSIQTSVETKKKEVFLLSVVQWCSWSASLNDTLSPHIRIIIYNLLCRDGCSHTDV